MPALKKHSTSLASMTRSSFVDAVTLLTSDHREVRTLFQKYEKLAHANRRDRQPLAETICDLLIVHAAIEEEIFYPAVHESIDDRPLIEEAEVEHASAKNLIAQIRDMGPGDDLYDAKVIVLGEYIEHHVMQEETEMFPKAMAAGMDLAGTGVRLLARKNELMSDLVESARR